MLQLSFFEDEQKTHCFVCVPFNAYELLFPAQRAELQERVLVACRQALKCQKLVCLLCSNRSRTMMERLKKKWQHDVSEWLVNEFMLLMWS